MHRIKDKHKNVPAEYLHAETSAADAAIRREIAIATAELTISTSSADIASDDDDDQAGGNSGSDSEAE